MINLNEMKTKDLKEIAKGMKVSNWWNLKKEKLIDKITDAIADREEKNPDFDIEKMFPQFVTGNVAVEVEPKVEEKPEVESEVEEKPEETEETPLKPKRGALIEYDGKSQNICAWGKELGISPNTLYGRIYKMGWTVEKAFTTPARKAK